MIKNIIAAAALGAAAIGAQASTNLIANGGFDSTYSATSYIYNGTPASVAAAHVRVPVIAGTVADWTGSFVSIATNSREWGYPNTLARFNASTQGGYVAGLQADGVLSQDIDLAPGTYTLTWLDANRGASQNYNVSLSYDGGSTIYGSSTHHTTVPRGGWNLETLTFRTTGGEGLLSFIGGTTYPRVDATSLIDNVQLTAVPEPSALVLMAMGTLGLLAWRRRAQV